MSQRDSPVLLRWRDAITTASGALASRFVTHADRYVRIRYAILFYSLLLTFVVAPVMAALQMPSGVTQLLLAGNLLIAVVQIGAGKLRRTLLWMVPAALAIRYLAPILGPGLSSALSIWTVAGLLAALSALRYVLRTKSVKSEHIYAALSAYLLAGFSFGVLYWTLERTWPGTLVYAGVPQKLSQADGIYFSFVTLATLGYGDFVPKTDLARGLTILEAVAGQLYLGVMVARLVSLYVTRSGSDN